MKIVESFCSFRLGVAVSTLCLFDVPFRSSNGVGRYLPRNRSLSLISILFINVNYVSLSHRRGANNFMMMFLWPAYWMSDVVLSYIKWLYERSP